MIDEIIITVMMIMMIDEIIMAFLQLCRNYSFVILSYSVFKLDARAIWYPTVSGCGVIERSVLGCRCGRIHLQQWM